MKVTVELIYDDKTKDRKLTLDVRSKAKGSRLMDAIDRAVEKAAADDREWTRWNLISIE